MRYRIQIQFVHEAQWCIGSTSSMSARDLDTARKDLWREVADTLKHRDGIPQLSRMVMEANCLVASVGEVIEVNTIRHRIVEDAR